jgi:hypothetical protein
MKGRGIVYRSFTEVILLTTSMTVFRYKVDSHLGHFILLFALGCAYPYLCAYNIKMLLYNS